MNSLLRIAFRNVLRNRRRSLITFSAIFLALGVMLSVRGCLNGMQASIHESVIFGQTGALQIHHRGFLNSISGASLDLNVPTEQAFLDRISSVKGVKAVSARIAFGAMVNANDATTAALLTAIDPQHETEVCPRRAEMISSGRALAAAGPRSGIFTPELAANLGLKLGQSATLLTGDRDGVMNALDLELVGAYGQAGAPLPDKKIGFVPLALAQELLRMEGTATELVVAVHRLQDVESLKPVLQAAVGPEYEVSSWRDVAPWVEEAIAAQNFMVNVLAGIFLFVALLGVVNTMLMSVYERTREIGTMMSVGVRRRHILRLFLLEAGLLGLCGGILGSAAGGGLVLYLARQGITIKIGGMSAPMHIYPFLDAGYVLFVLMLAAGGAVVAALWPSMRASRLRPVEALAGA